MGSGHGVANGGCTRAAGVAVARHRIDMPGLHADAVEDPGLRRDHQDPVEGRPVADGSPVETRVDDEDVAATVGRQLDGAQAGRTSRATVT